MQATESTRSDAGQQVPTAEEVRQALRETAQKAWPDIEEAAPQTARQRYEVKMHEFVEATMEMQAERDRWANVKKDDPTTWPEAMQQHRQGHLDSHRIWEDRPADGGLDGVRFDVLYEAVVQRLGETFLFANCALQYLLRALREGTVESRLAWELDGEVDHIIFRTIDICLELVPRLQRLLPFADEADVFEALFADARNEEQLLADVNTVLAEEEEFVE